MKKFKNALFIAALSAMCLSFAACGAKEEAVEIPEDEYTEYSDEPEEEYVEEAEEEPVVVDYSLTQMTAFPGNLSSVTIGFPNRFEYAELQNGLLFCVKDEEVASEDEDHSTIIVGFIMTDAYDKYLDKGSGIAKKYMEAMLNNIEKAFFEEKLLQQIEGNIFTDGGSYYDIKGGTVIDGSFADCSVPVCASVELRYYGPYGFVMYMITIAPEGSYEDFTLLSSQMVNSCNLTSGWSTAPKEVPATPKPAKVTSSQSAETYYWEDEDGDIWFWNGEYNEFVGFGQYYYLDDDGNFLESNDDGWDEFDDWDDEDFWDFLDDEDPWSDPGDYDEEDDDPWSDPGDYDEEDDDPWSDPGDYDDEDDDVWSDPGDYDYDDDEDW